MSRSHLSKSSRDYDPEAALEQNLLFGYPVKVRPTSDAEPKPATPSFADSGEPGALRLVLDQAEVDATRDAHRDAESPSRQGAGSESPPKPMPDLPARGKIAALGTRRNGAAPKRIGKGTLVRTRLTWKPGDPFGNSEEKPGSAFRWELMLASACVTAAGGLFCVWLLHSILA
jgi:hypothetical protein